MAQTLGPPTWATGSWATDAWADGAWAVDDPGGATGTGEVRRHRLALFNLLLRGLRSPDLK